MGGRAHVKRIRTSASWPSAQPANVAALLRPAPSSNGSEPDAAEIAGAAESWARSATLTSLLEAMGRLDTSSNRKAPFQVLLNAAREKATTLQQHNDALGGGALRSALEAQQKAEAEAAAAKQLVAELKSKIDASFAAL